MAEDKSQDILQLARDLFRKGDLAGAEVAAGNVVRQMKTMAPAPVPDIMILKAFYLCRLNRPQKARALFGNVLEVCPDDGYAQAGYLLALQDELAAEGRSDIQPAEESTLLLGIGTGRSGSTTLTKLWQQQENCYCSHEHPPRLGWDFNMPRFDFHKRRIALLQRGYRFVGDVSHWWLPYIDQVLENYRNVRVVVLKREKEATVNSFLKIKGGGRKGTINHWIDHDGSYWARNVWDECYPVYDVTAMGEAIGRYWDDYYSTAEILAQRLPSSIRIFSTERLGERATQDEILSFCGFERPRTIDDLHLNKGSISDGVRMY